MTKSKTSRTGNNLTKVIQHFSFKSPNGSLKKGRQKQKCVLVKYNVSALKDNANATIQDMKV